MLMPSKRRYTTLPSAPLPPASHHAPAGPHRGHRVACPVEDLVVVLWGEKAAAFLVPHDVRIEGREEEGRGAARRIGNAASRPASAAGIRYVAPSSSVTSAVSGARAARAALVSRAGRGRPTTPRRCGALGRRRPDRSARGIPAPAGR